ncbi:MAG: Abi family protein [Prevotellaceae bacterium]|jgi:abortive infection bacteriophage resistance protein|nr:Abi family protein [Prevotellaceae bacterium]
MLKVPYTKSVISHPDQIVLLKSRGMKFADESKAMHLLENISYHRMSAYWYPLLADKHNHVFKPDADFETAFSLYKFDSELRKLIISELEKIEVAVRSKIAYILSLEHDAFWMEDSALFTNQQAHQATLNKIQDELNRSDEEFILSFKSKYSNPLPPSFIVLEITSFGALSRLYDMLKPCKSKKEIANMFGLSDKVFASWLHSFVYVRNVCAHHTRIWNRWLRIQPLFPKNPAGKWLLNKNTGNNRLYYTLSMILYLLNIVNPKHTFRQKLEHIFLKYPNVDRVAMGFPADWQNEPLWIA